MMIMVWHDHTDAVFVRWALIGLQILQRVCVQFQCSPSIISLLVNFAAVGSESPACHKLIAIQVHTAAQLIYKMTWGRETRCHVPLFQLEQSFWFVFTVWHSAFQFIWNTQEQWEEFARKHTHPFHISPRSTYSVHNNSTPQILLFQKNNKKIPFDFTLSNETVEGERQVNNQSL